MKTTFIYDHYYKYAELEAVLKHFAENCKQLMDLEVNCLTPKGRKQYVAILTNKQTGPALDKPAFYLDGNIHAGEVTSSMCALYTLDYLLSNYDSDQEVQSILDEYTIYIIPRVTPDGAEAYLSTPYVLRSADREYLPEKGGIRGEDLDGDGVIRMMRIKTPYGAWKQKEDDPDLMVPRDPSDKKGEFYDIFPEGVLEEYEGCENLKSKKSDWGLDFNRNFPYGWFPEGRQEGAGVYPLSNPETKAVVDFVLAHPNIGGAAIGHTSGGIILYPPGTHSAGKAPQGDIKLLKQIALMGEEELGYKPLNIFDSFLSSQENYDSGALDDWMFETQGIPAYTMEFWDVSTKAGVPVKWQANQEPDPKEEMERFAAILKWVKQEAPQYYESWKEYDHPAFGKVEIGGFNIKFTHQNPPEKYLLKELENDARFNIRFIKALPQLKIAKLKAEKVEENIYKVEAVVGNTGYLSTALTQTAINIKADKPVMVSIEGAEVLAGQKETEIKELSGYGATQSGVWFYGNISTRETAKARKKLSWLIRAAKGSKITVSACQAKAGKAEAYIVL